MNRTYLRDAILLFVGLCWLGVLWAVWYQDNQAGDFYPIYIGIQALFRGESPYSPQVAFAIKSSWAWAKDDNFIRAFCAYPIPVLIIFSPLGLLPIGIAAIFWQALLLVSILLAWLCLGRNRRSPALWLLFFPLSHVLYIQNTSALWFALSAFMLFKWKNLRPSTLGALSLLLCLKPQAGALIGISALIESWKSSKRPTIYFIIFAALILGAAQIIQPGWMAGWITTLIHYRQMMADDPIIVSRALLIVASVGLPLRIAAPVLQFAIFPPNDIYCALSLLLVWQQTRPRVAWLGVVCAAFSALIYVFPMESIFFVAPLCIPMIIVLLAEPRWGIYKTFKTSFIPIDPNG